MTKHAIVVLGFHRSGTSALTGVIDALGAYSGNDLIPPSHENEKGFFENMRVYEANEYILQEQGISWNNLDGEKHVDFNRMLEVIRFALKTSFNSNPVIVVKDPRICLFIPVYSSVLKSLGYEVSYVKTFRPAEEIASSVSFRYVVPLDKTLNLIQQYSERVDNCSDITGGCSVINFKGLITNPDVVINTLKKDFPFLNYSEENIAKAKAFLSPDLKHF